MKIKAIILLLFMSFASANHADITNSDAMAYSIRTILLDGDPQQVSAIGQVLLGPPQQFFKGRMEIDGELANLSAELAHKELQKKTPNPLIVIWMMRILAESEYPRFTQFIQQVADSDINSRIKKSAVDALNALGEVDENTDMYISGSLSIDDYRQELVAFKKSESLPLRRPKKLVKAIKKAGKIEKVYSLLGYPDHIETSFRFGPTGRVAIMTAYWDNVAMVIFQDKKPRLGVLSLAPKVLNDLFSNLLKNMRVAGVRELDDLSNSENALAILNSPKAKESKKLLKNMHNANVIPLVLLDEMEKLIGKQLLEFDKRQSDNLIYMSQLLGRSRNTKYFKILEDLWQAELNKDTKVIALRSLAQLYSQTHAIEKLMSMMNTDDSSAVRVTARAVFTNRINDDRMLDFLVERILQDISTDDRLLADGFAVMCKTIGEAGVKTYLPSLEHITQQAKNNGVRDHCKNAVRLLKE